MVSPSRLGDIIPVVGECRDGARQIGTGWAAFETVLAGADGTIFAMRGNGDLLWYRYIVADLTTGRGSWAPRSGSRIGTGFTRFPRLFGGYDNVIWGIDPAGYLYRYQYLRKDGLLAPVHGPAALASEPDGIRSRTQSPTRAA